MDAEEKERLAVSWEKIQASGGITALQEENDQLLAWQKTVDSPEALACIPSLQVLSCLVIVALTC